MYRVVRFNQKKILLVQLASHGDCLFVTVIARQIKEVDYPGCHLTWMIGAPYKKVIEGNFYIDEIIEISMTQNNPAPERLRINKHISDIQNNQEFDKIFITDCVNENLKNWYGTTRSSLFRSYPHKLKVSVEPMIFLTGNEIHNVKKFAEHHSLIDNASNILFECAPQSAQSNMTFERAYEISSEVICHFPKVKFILSSSNAFVSSNPNIIDGSVISWKENSELTKYCHLMVGCSSGISWLNTSNHGQKIPMVQDINPNYWESFISASVKVDFQYFGLKTNKLIEFENASNQQLIDCILQVLENGFTHTKDMLSLGSQIYYGSRFTIDVLKNGSFKRGNCENLKLTTYLIKKEFEKRCNDFRILVVAFLSKFFKYLKKNLK
ncbi:MAG: hypothetical protein JWP81_1926 [Ferruginibacter sp.]|nr:hypothetical protein [Ferruginibacter sp.]